MDYSYYYTFDLPVEYKGLKIYPISIKDFNKLYYYSECFTVEKNRSRDIKIISMSELSFLYYSTINTPEKTPYLFFLDRILGMSIKEDNSFYIPEKSIDRYKMDDKGNPFFSIGGVDFYNDDYMNIRNIICEQNMIELPDPNMSTEVRESLEFAKRYKQKLSGSKPGTMEDSIVALATVTGWSLEYIYSLSIRKFTKSIERFDAYITYKIYLSAILSGFREFKDTSSLKHWLADLSTDKYADVKVDMSELQSKIDMGNGIAPSHN